ncbi:DUF418 domain-containing protein [Staphylococcus capitis]|uniref:DUF418 domain-containing protein n=1 Tax=Staphylococcus capitis TaxID=29388 RepID=UPI000CD234CA|nr:DUF418 domain-containing protein [Staphylococcus capitis]PNZ78318.1 hypothetical protein CD038_02245 [Staphylococcus capitis subsp. capitis]GGI36953.1 membrane protein [Staphylococcus capitis]VTR12395.1 membrane protein [Staphylococcus capitis]
MDKKRIVELDIIRGIAISVVLFANVSEVLPIFGDEKKPHFTSLDCMIKQFFSLFIDGRFIMLFTLLFGIGMGIFMNNARKKSLSPLKLMFRRLLFLFVVGIFGMILSLPYAEYAICGAVIMWLFLLPQARYNLWISILTLLSIIIMTFVDTNSNLYLIDAMAVMLFGMYMSQSGMIYRFKHHRKFFLNTFLICLAAIIVLIGIKYIGSNLSWMNIEDLVTPFQTLIYFIILLFITDKESVQRLLVPFEKLGKTAFTNFMAQMLLLYFFIRFVFPYNHPTPIQSICIALPILIISMLVTHWWLKRYRKGPLEALWRKWTYKNVPKKVKVAKEINS